MCGKRRDRGDHGSFPPETRAQVTALACSLPDALGWPVRRWDCVEIRNRLVQTTTIGSIHRTTVWRWLKAERLKPWRHHLWQHPTAPDFLGRAKPVLQLYAHAQALLRKGIWVVCSDEKTSMQALERVHPLRPAASGQPMHVAAHYVRRGVSHLFGALSVADGRVYGTCRRRKRFEDFQAFFRETVVPEALRRGVSRICWILDNGSTHAPMRLKAWLDEQRQEHGWPFTIRVFWLPKYASWLDQIEVWFSILQRKVLTPIHENSLETLEHGIAQYIDHYNRTAQPIRWTYTVDKLTERLATL